MTARLDSARIILRYGILIALIMGSCTTRAFASDNENGITLRLLPFSDYIRFNRVEGLYLGAGTRVDRSSGEHGVYGAQLSGGYALSAKEGRYGLTAFFAHIRSRSNIALLSAGVYRRLDTIGSEPMGLGGNTVTALFFKEDYLDYYDREGIQMHLMEKYRGWTLTADATIENNYSLPAATQKSMSGIDGDFRSNPSIDEGELRCLSFGLGFDRTEIPGIYPQGHKHELEFAIAGGDGLGGDFEFRRVDFTNSLFVRGLWSHLLAIHADIGASADTLPRQYAFHLGGPGSLRGLPVNYLRGNHYWLLRLDHYLPYQPLSWLRFHNPFFYALRPIVFGDAGSVWTSSDFWSASREDTHTNLGIGIGDTDNLFRIDCAWLVDGDRQKPLWTVLINYRW
jgi:hypothetical protein